MSQRLLKFIESRPWILSLVLWTVTFVTLGGTLLPQEQFPESNMFEYDKIAHFFIFGIWTFLLGVALHLKGQRPFPYLGIFLAGALFGLTIELLQEILPVNRSMSLSDWIADVLGSLAAVGILRQWLKT